MVKVHQRKMNWGGEMNLSARRTMKASPPGPGSAQIVTHLGHTDGPERPSREGRLGVGARGAEERQPPRQRPESLPCSQGSSAGQAQNLFFLSSR